MGHATHNPQLVPNQDGTLLDEGDVLESGVSRSELTSGQADHGGGTGCHPR